MEESNQTTYLINQVSEYTNWAESQLAEGHGYDTVQYCKMLLITVLKLCFILYFATFANAPILLA